MSETVKPSANLPEFLNRTVAHVVAAGIITVCGLAIGHSNKEPDFPPLSASSQCEAAPNSSLRSASTSVDLGH